MTTTDQTALYSAICRLTADDDLRQDAWIAAQRIHGRRPDLPLRRLASWAVRTARRQAHDGRRHTPAISTEAVTNAAVSPLPALTPEERIDWQDYRATLTERERHVIDLLTAGHRAAEVAESLGVHRAQIGRLVQRVADGYRAVC